MYQFKIFNRELQRISVIQPFDNPIGTSSNPTISTFIWKITIKLLSQTKNELGVVLKAKLINNMTDYLMPLRM